MKVFGLRSLPAAAIGLLVSQGAFAAGAEDYQARSWSAGCAACHGTEGRGGFQVPAIAGRPKAELYASMKEFKADQRKGATIMHQHAKGYTDVQLERIAEYFSRQSR